MAPEHPEHDPYGTPHPPVSADRIEVVEEKSQSTGGGSDTKNSSDDYNEDVWGDMDALIEDLESLDGHVDEDYGHSDDFVSPRPVPDELLQTNPRTGLTDSEVLVHRKKYGLNQMKEETENLFLKFLSYFVGPIQFVMEVRLHCGISMRNCFRFMTKHLHAHHLRTNRLPQFSPPVSRTGLILASSVLSLFSMPRLVSSRNTRPDPSSRS